jgi:hypothetical protein
LTAAFACDGFVIAVDAPDPEQSWLDEFLGPAFRRLAGQPGDVCVTFEAGTGDTDGAWDAGTRVAFALDSGPIRLPESPIPGGTRFHDARGAVDFDVTSGGSKVHVRYHASRLDARVRLMRVVREYAHNHSVCTGGVVLHAAGLTVGGVAVAVAGSKYAGKTTVALRLLALPGAAYLSNDRVLVRPGRETGALAIPTVIGIREGTRVLMPGLAGLLQSGGDFRENAGERQARGPRAPDTVGETWHVGPAQLCAALGRSRDASAPLAAVLFPTGDRTSTSYCRRLGHAEASAALGDALLCRRSGHYASEVFVASPDSPPNGAHMESRCRDLASRVACFACALPGDGAVEDAASLLRECLGSEP